MKYFSTVFAKLRPVQAAVSFALAAALFFTAAYPAWAAKSSPSEGITVLEKIEQKSQDAIDDPALSLKDAAKRSEKGFNEIQGDADRNKMLRSKGSESPAMKKVEKALGGKKR